ncbi:hypothetical protein GQ44DRAFT_715905 [Phaeosphaeriaceae sp. PMI808]|nr:hypothetical protein GQ44DRAFT_715905 [Phaeosphaeriaceae sp. PMI808]
MILLHERCTSRLVEALCLVCCDCNTFSLPLMFGHRLCWFALMPSGLRICSLSSDVRSCCDAAHEVPAWPCFVV